MAEKPKPDTDSAAAEEAASKPAGAGKYVMVGFISTLMVIETALFFFLVPSGEEVAALAEARLVQRVQAGEQDAAEQESEENQVQEFDLGSFGETFSPIDADNRYRVEFRLFGLVKQKDVEKLTTEFDAKAGRLRHAIRMKVRNSELSELEENQLGLLQRRILTTCNHLLEDDLLLSVGFNDYQVFQE
ncbi:dihydrolipoamide acetyltransferase [Candidatus Laterigemmans baculatus]|uniref:dihydrolipoamide acetyltransferase n=1 Tax=Candidatus Laterigemmans baculatus TaxID=2770505 RepID=UPI0013DBF58D|nr:dihydrolipoamide acetyltransferase [Candidatus Laterigemmans baculatus]